MKPRLMYSLFGLVVCLLFFVGCATQGGNESDETSQYAFGKSLEESGYPQGAIAMYSSSVSLGEIVEEQLHAELDRLLVKLGKKAFDTALEEAYAFLEDQRKEGIAEGDELKAKLNASAIKYLQAWERLSGTNIWRKIIDM